MKIANRKGLLLFADNYRMRQRFRWYHTNGFIRFQLLRIIRMQTPALNYLGYLFWGESCKKIKPEPIIGT